MLNSMVDIRNTLMAFYLLTPINPDYISVTLKQKHCKLRGIGNDPEIL